MIHLYGVQFSRFAFFSEQGKNGPVVLQGGHKNTVFSFFASAIIGVGLEPHPAC